MNYWKSLWPSNPPTHVVGKEQIVILRERLLQTLFLSAFALSTLVYGFLLSIVLRNNSSGGIVFLTGIFIILLVLTLIRKLAYIPRAISFIAILFVIGTISMLQFGNSGSGFLLLITFVTVTIILLGPLAGFGSTILSILTAILIPYGIENSQFILSPDVLNPNTGLGWARSGSIFVLAVGIISISISIIIMGLQRSLQQSFDLSKDLQEQRGSLSKAVQDNTINL